MECVHPRASLVIRGRSNILAEARRTRAIGGGHGRLSYTRVIGIVRISRAGAPQARSIYTYIPGTLYTAEHFYESRAAVYTAPRQRHH